MQNYKESGTELTPDITMMVLDVAENSHHKP